MTRVTERSQTWVERKLPLKGRPERAIAFIATIALDSHCTLP